MDGKNSLWRSIAGLRGLDVPERRERPSIVGDRFEVLLSRALASDGLYVQRARNMARDPGCHGVVGEIVVADPAAGAAPQRRTRRRTSLAWGRALVER